ncbi:MAG: hypothetical protein IIC13_07590 [SAR324 cluster bacterium]|nr:hypothetical protein [SAR324 cluster bacterium]MCH8886435.1 hypothetical protein [SAR324 cluster bacterium]
MAHNFRTPIGAMSENQREWFAMALVAMVIADGEVSQAETQTLVQSISFIKNPTLVESLKKYISHQTVPNLTAFVGWDTLPKNRAFMMLDLMDVAISDRDFSPKEKEQFLHIGNLLGMPKFKVEELIEYGAKATLDMPEEG